MENKTAVEWLIEQLEQELSDDVEVTSEIWVSVKNKALELEKQQIVDAFLVGDNECVYNEKDAEEYYCETYKNTTE